MANLVATSKDSQVLHRSIVPVAEEIQTQLRDILASPSFHGSKRCQQFLESVCLKSLSGEIGSLKERSIAVEVFGRQPQADMGDGVGAREVRKRLAQYYVTANGVSAPVVIDLPSGSYAPEFRYAAAKDILSPEPVSPAPTVQPVISHVARYWPFVDPQ